MQYWVLKADDLRILISDKGNREKGRPHCAKPNIPKFHYSSTPWHLIIAMKMISVLARGFGFHNRNQH
jgi:hypothetical protein